MLASLLSRGRRPVLLLAVVVAAVFFGLASWMAGSSTALSHHAVPTSFRGLDQQWPAEASEPQEMPGEHPIDVLMAIADGETRELLQKETTGVDAAARAYRAARGRHPPPKFDAWVRWCEAHDVLMIEDFYDPMYRDLAPFWGVTAEAMRESVKSWASVISIRNGSLHSFDDEFRPVVDWTSHWEKSLRQLPLRDLPDVDLAFNGEDEPKIFAAWETVEAALKRAESEHPGLKTPTVTDAYRTLPPLPTSRPPSEDRTGFAWANTPYADPLWRVGRESCAPDSRARRVSAEEDWTATPEWPDADDLEHMRDGFVANYTAAKSSCVNPHLRSLHASWTGMNSYSQNERQLADTKAITRDLVPLLSGCKLNSITSEILVPPAMQILGDTGSEFDVDQNLPRWEDMKDGVMWRGSASGGINDENNWTRFQRHRIVAMANGSLVARHERVRDTARPAHAPANPADLPFNFPLPDRRYELPYEGAADPPSALQAWIDGFADVAFTHLMCWPPIAQMVDNGQTCAYDGRFYLLSERRPAAEKYGYKYIPDMDGMSYSGAFRSLLQSNSVPVKGTVYDTWDDARLLPWRHFVPMDNTFLDWYALMDYFLGYSPSHVEGVADDSRTRLAHDDAGRRIAAQGSRWAGRVLRGEDQLAWMYRLILEMARLGDDRRLEMGFVGDLPI